MRATRPLRMPSSIQNRPIPESLRSGAADVAVRKADDSYRPGVFNVTKPRSMPRVLHVGCGANSSSRLHDIFKLSPWQEIRCDIDNAARPDIQASIVNLRPWVADESCDAIWASHILEHLARHEVPLALSEFVRVLSPKGFALVRSPDIHAVAEFILEGRLADVIYTSPAGPITPLDMIYGHGAAIAQENLAMRHGTAFTQELLGCDLLDAGFSEVRTTRTKTYEVWAVAFMPEANSSQIIASLDKLGINFQG